MKILMVTDAYYPYPSGLSEYVHHLSESLRSFGHDVDIVATSFGSREDERFKVMRVGRVVMVPLNGSYATMPFGFDVPGKMKWIVREGNYDVVHLNGPIFPSLSYFALKYSRAKTVVTFHTSSEKTKGFGSGIFKKIFGKIYEKIDVRIAVSENAKKNHEIYMPGDYYIIPIGVDIDRFCPKGDTLKEMEKNSILFVGRMDQRKGLHRLIEAFVFVKKEIQDAKIYVVGTGPLYKKYTKMVDAYGLKDSVYFKGFVSNEMIPTYFRSATVYTSPAEGGESFGIVLIEAMASGTAVIASNIAGYDRVVDHNRNGMLVDTKNPQEYAKALIRVMRDNTLRKKYVAEGLKDVNTRYSWNTVARKIERLYFT